MRKWIILTLILVSILFSISSCGGFGSVGEIVVPYNDKSFTVGPFQSHSLTVTMRSGTILEGYLTVRGGNNDDIRFYIKDSYGNKVLDINKVRGRYDFSYVATSDGFHTMYFDNGFSWFTSKLVLLHYRVR